LKSASKLSYFFFNVTRELGCFKSGELEQFLICKKKEGYKFSGIKSDNRPSATGALLYSPLIVMNCN